jgi:Protein of unknwon function (DUF3310)
MSKKETVTSKILELLKKDLNRSAKEIAEIVGTSPSYVYAVKHKSLRAPIKISKPILNPVIEMIEPKADPVNHPPHYKAGGIETIDFIEAKKLNYNLGNVVKYLTRADLKGNRKQDLEKALWYLNRELSNT